MEAVCLMRSKPSRPAEANQRQWGDRRTDAGPSGWPFTSWIGFSWTTCWLVRPSVSLEYKSRVETIDSYTLTYIETHFRSSKPQEAEIVEVICSFDSKQRSHWLQERRMWVEVALCNWTVWGREETDGHDGRHSLDLRETTWHTTKIRWNIFGWTAKVLFHIFLFNALIFIIKHWCIM